jgi:N-acyl-L-homoserine lactone synthetase
MPIRILHARDEGQIDQVFRLRHQVFCQEENLFQTNGSQFVLDRYDAFPASKLFVVLGEEDQVVGSVRVTLDNPAGLPADDYFDFRAHVPQDSRVMSISMFCVAKPYRNAMIASGLLTMCAYYALSQQVDYICAPLNPAIANLIRRIGAKQLTDEPQTVPNLNDGFLPCLLHLPDMNETYAKFARQNVTNNMIQSFECMIFRKGEQIIRKDDVGDCAYLIASGSVAVMHPVTSQPMAELTEGDVFGELALFSSDNVRTTDVFASSMTRVMVLPKKALLEHIRTSPEAGLNLLHVMTKRMMSVLVQDSGDKTATVQQASPDQ